MSANFLTHANAYMTANVKTVYLEELSKPTDSPGDLLSYLKQDMSWDNETKRWYVRNGLLDGVAFGVGNFGETPDTSLLEASVSLLMMTQRIKFDRRTIEFSKNTKAAYIKILDDALANAATARRRAIESVLIRPSLGTIDTAGVTDNGSGSYTVVISAATWADGAMRLNDMVNVGSSTDIFRVRGITRDSRAVTIIRDDGGSKVPLAADVIYRQKASGNTAVSLYDIIESSSSLHGLARQYEWESTKISMSSKPATLATYEELLTKIYQKSGEYPDLLVMSPTQELKLRRTVRDNMISQYDGLADRVDAKGKESVAVIPNVTYISIAGRPLKVVSHSMLPAGTAYMINSKQIEIVSHGAGSFVPGLEGGILHPQQVGAHKDTYEAMWLYDYAVRCVNPKYHGGITGASTTLEHVTL